jgi:DNA end-binding protein Ku
VPDDKSRDMARLAAWSGTITFGVVAIPVALFPANRSVHVSLRMVSPDGTPLKRRYFCPRENKALDPEEIVRGYEVGGDRFVTVSDEELANLDPEKSREIDLRRFVPTEQIDPLFFDRAYFLAPAGDIVKPYRLLVETMARTGLAGIATFVMRSREYLVAILAEDGLLRAATLRFADEVRPPEDAGLAPPQKVEASLVRFMAGEIQAAAADALDLEEMRNHEDARLLELVAGKKAAARKMPPSPAEEQEGGRVIDMMEVLRRSMERSDAARNPDRKRGEEEDLSRESRERLYERARELDVAGRSTMRKGELVQALREARKRKKRQPEGGRA